MSAVATKPRGKVQQKALPPERKQPMRLSEPQPAKHSPPWLAFDLRDKLLTGLYSSRAAVSMLMLVFSNEPRIDEPKAGIHSLMGTLQYARRQLDAINEQVTELCTELDDLYWSIFGASSLIALLEEIEWADGFQWRIGDEMVCDHLTAAYDCMGSAIDYLENSEVQS